MIWQLWVGLAVLGTVAVGLGALHLTIVHRYMPILVRIFQEKPLFILPFGQPVNGGEDVTLTTVDGTCSLQGCYLRCAATQGRDSVRAGVRLEPLGLRALLRIPA